MSTLLPVSPKSRKEDYELCEIEEPIVIPNSTEDESSTAVEHIFPLEKFTFIPNYFGYNLPESIEIEIEGRKVTLNGINIESATREFEEILSGIVEQVVNKEILKAVLDSFIVKELTLAFSKLSPFFSARGRATILHETYRLHDEERDEIFREIDRFEGIVATPGDVREALGRLSSEKLKRILIEAIDPVVTSKELQAAQEAIRIRQMKQPFKNLIDPIVKPKELLQALHELPVELKKHFKNTINLVEKRIEVFLTLIDEYAPLHIIQFVLGEEWYKRMEKSIPIKWKIPKESVPKLHEFIECHIKGVQERYSDPDPEEAEMAANSLKIAEAEIRESFQKFQVIQDYYVSDEVLPLLISIVKMPLHPWPRVEKVKQALRAYFRIENILKSTTEQMLAFIMELRKKLSSEGKTRLLKDLAEASKDEELKILQNLNAPNFTEEERLAVVAAIQIFLPEENEFLDWPIEAEPDSDDEIEAEAEPIDLEVPIDLCELDRAAKRTLETSCCEAEIQVVFRQNGKDIYLGAPKMNQKVVEAYLAELEEDPEYVKLD